ncbi:DNA-binding Xre family transcriptional regulator [Arthrobacter sp. UYEF6]
MKIEWKLRMAAARREVWTGVQLRRLLAEKSGLELSSASISALLTKEPNQIKLSTLIALCTALDCTPNDLFEVDTTPLKHPVALRCTTDVRHSLKGLCPCLLDQPIPMSSRLMPLRW